MSTEVILDIKKLPNKTTFGTTVITFITDPFNPLSSRQVSTDLHGRTLDTYLKGYCLGAQYLVKVNGKLFEGDVTSYVVKPNDNITYVSTIAGGGGGGGKQIITLVAMIALTVVSGGAAAGFFATAGGLFAAGSVSALMLSAGISIIGALLINSILAPGQGSAGVIKSPELESRTYSWTGIQTSRDINTPIPVLYGTHALGGTVINNRFYYKGSDDWLAVQLALCHGEIEEITPDKIKVQDADFSTFVGNPVGSDGFFEYASGRFDQPIMSGFSDSIYNNGAVSRQLAYNTTFSFTTESTNIDFFRLHFEFPKGLYSMDSQGNKSTREVSITAKYRKVGTSTWYYLYSRVPTYTTEYRYRIHDDEGYTLKGYWSTVYEANSVASRAVFTGYTLAPSLLFSNSSSVAFKQYFEPTTPTGETTILPIGRYEFEVTRTTQVDSDTDVYNVSESHVRFLEEINSADINYGGVAMLGINIKATDQLSSQRPNFTTTVTRKPLYLAGAYRDSTNPAWISYDMLTNKHYGMGIDPNMINLTEFNTWAEFCNGLISSTYTINKTSTVVSTANSFNNMLVIPEVDIPVNEVLTLNGINKNASSMVAVGTVYVNNAYQDVTLNINAVTNITRMYVTGSPYRPNGYYYYIQFRHPLKTGSTFSYTISHKTQATVQAPKLSFNGVFDTTSDVWSILQEVAKVGRGQVILQGTKYSCIFDAPKTVVGLYNAANSNNVVVSYMNTADIASEIELQYTDKNIGYEMTSISIQDAGMMNSGSRSNKTSQTVKGITTEAEALVYGRYLLATSKYIRRVITLDADIESITQSVGDLIAVQTDVTQYGKGGLVSSVVGQLVTLDDMVYLTVGSEYTLKIKRISDDVITDYNFIASVTSPLSTLTFDSLGTTQVGVITFDSLSLVVHEVNGSSISTNTLIIPEGYEISKDDRYTFGLKGSDSILCIITDISRDGDLKRQITAAEYNESILDFNYDNDVLQRIEPTLRPKNSISNLKISDRLVKSDNTTVAMMSLSWDSTVSSYYNIYIMEDGFKNYLVNNVKGTRYEYAAVDLVPEKLYRIYIEDALDMGIITYSDYTITSFSSPPENITSFTVTPINDYLSFVVNYPNEPLDFSHYDVYENDVLISRQLSSKFSIPATLGKTSYLFKLVPVDSIGKRGNSISLTTTINAPVISNITYTQEKEFIKFNINALSSGFNIDYYSFTASGLTGTSKDSMISIIGDWVGTKTFSFRVYDLAGIASTAHTVDVSITVPVPVNIASTIDVKDAVIRWDSPLTGLPIEYYEVEYDGNVYKTKSNQYRLPIYWSGTKSFSVRSVNTLGGVSSSVNTAVTITNATISSLKAEVIDNNVLLTWSATQGSLPIETFVLYKGPTIGSLVEIGRKSGTFTTVFESKSGTYTYWMAPVDSAGNLGDKVSVTTIVNQPPDYVLNIDWYSSFSGTLVNAKLESNSLVLPINTTETITEHFTSRSWTTAQEQVNAGYPLWIEPFSASGSYTEVFDYGTVLASSLVTVNLDKTIIKGAPITTITISLSTNGVTYTDYTGQNQVYGTGFRYVKIKVDVSGTNSAVALNTLNVRLDSKLINDSGTGVITNAPSGVIINFTKPFIDVSSIQVTPSGSSPLYAVYEFIDTPNPTQFTVYLYNNTGSRVTGNFSWGARGY